MLEEIRRELAMLEVFDDGGRQKRGIEFEQLLFALLEGSGLEPRMRFRPRGEEVDGSFILDGRVFLLEAKWLSEPVAASSIYAFRGKIDGKLQGTYGLFLSMAGFSSDAVNALRFGKTQNILLVDQEDFRFCLRSNDSFRSVVFSKFRHASETGNPYFPYASMSIDVARCRLETEEIVPSAVPTSQLLSDPAIDILFIVEEKLEREIVCGLAARVLRDRSDCPKIGIVVANGRYGLASLANAVGQGKAKVPRIVALASLDGDEERTENAIKSQFEGDEIDIIVLRPDIGEWFRDAGVVALPPRTLIKRIAVRNLARQSQSFAKFCEVLGTRVRCV